MLPEPSFTIWSVIFLIIAAQGLFLATLLAFYNKSNRTANKVMAVFVGAFSLTLCYYVLFWTGYSCNFMWTKGWCSALPFLFGPLMYLYISVIKNGELPFRYKLHFIPFAIHFTYMLPFIYWFTTGPEVIATSNEPLHVFLQQAIFRHLDVVTRSFQVFNAIQFASLISYSILLIHLHAKQKKYSNEGTQEPARLKWYLINIAFFSVFACLFSSYWIALWLGILPGGLDNLVSGIMCVCIYWIGYSAFRQPRSEFESKTKSRKKQFNPDKMIEQTNKLKELLEIKKPWLDSELNLNKLADMLQMPPHELSFIINSSLHKNFADLMHEYRIKEACRLLVEESYSGSKILSIAFDVGYTNKATFNAAFKQIMGVSPSVYKLTAINSGLKQQLN